MRSAWRTSGIPLAKVCAYGSSVRPIHPPAGARRPGCPPDPHLQNPDGPGVEGALHSEEGALRIMHSPLQLLHLYLNIPFRTRVSLKSTQSGHRARPSRSSTTRTTSCVTRRTGTSTTRGTSGRSATTRRRRTRRATTSPLTTMRSRTSSTLRSRRTEVSAHRRLCTRYVLPSPLQLVVANGSRLRRVYKNSKQNSRTSSSG